ncbi:tetratricopeptide repeat protein [Anaerolineales bacterium HSG25]|nr:tetratricopeptide repeat protein [Anaerolineales bacterium HSG25]
MSEQHNESNTTIGSTRDIENSQIGTFVSYIVSLFTWWQFLLLVGLMIVGLVGLNPFGLQDRLTGYYHLYQNQAVEGELLILIARFHHQEAEVQPKAIAEEIKEKLQEGLTQNGLAERARVEILSDQQTFRKTEEEEITALGEAYGATLVIWGEYDSLGIDLRSKILAEIDHPLERKIDRCFEAACPETILAPPNDYELVNIELPRYMTYLVNFTLGQIFYADDSYNQALNLFDRAIADVEPLENQLKQEPTDRQEIERNKFYSSVLNIYIYRGVIYFKLGQYQQGIEDYNKAIEIQPDNVRAYNYRGQNYNNLGQYQQAIADFDKAIKMLPNNAFAYTGRGSSYAYLGQYQQAIVDYDKAIQIQPNNSVAYNNRGSSYVYLGQFQQAIADFDKAIQIQPNNSVAYKYRGGSYAMLGQYQQALDDYDKAIEIQPDNVSVYCGRGVVHFTQEHWQDALTDWQECLANLPADDPRAEGIKNLITQAALAAEQQ